MVASPGFADAPDMRVAAAVAAPQRRDVVPVADRDTLKKRIWLERSSLDARCSATVR